MSGQISLDEILTRLVTSLEKIANALSTLVENPAAVRKLTETPLQMSTKQASLWLNERGCPIPASTLQHYRSMKEGGPKFTKVGRHVRYSVEDLSEWAGLDS